MHKQHGRDFSREKLIANERMEIKLSEGQSKNDIQAYEMPICSNIE